MKISASWSLELTKLVVMHPDAIFSLIKWQSTSMLLDTVQSFLLLSYCIVGPMSVYIYKSNM